MTIKNHKGDLEILGTVLLFYFSLVLLIILGSFTSQDQFSATLSDSQASSLSKYENHANLAALMQNETLVSKLTEYSYDENSRTEDNINQTVRRSLNNVYVLRLDDQTTLESDLALRNGQESFSYSNVYIASPKSQKIELTLGTN